MKTVEYWQWLIPAPNGKMVRTGYSMSEATALEAHPGAVRATGTMELRNVPDTDDDLRASFTSAWMRSK